MKMILHQPSSPGRKEDPNKIRNERGEITDTTETEKIIRKYYEYYVQQLDNLKEMTSFQKLRPCQD